MADHATRLAWVDYAKALAIGLVVFGHASRSIERTGGLAWSDGLRLADVLIYSFHIPLFFVLSGYTARLTAGRPLRSQAYGLFWGIAVPYFVWTAIWVALKVGFPDAANNPVGVSDLLHALWTPVEHMWFLQHLFLARLMWMAAERGGATEPGSSAATAIIAAMAVACVVLHPLGGVWQTVGSIFGNAAFVGLGFVWLPVLWEKRHSAWVAPAAVAAAVLWLLGVVALRPEDAAVEGLLLAVTACFWILAVVWRLHPPDSIAARTIAFVGEASLAIYVMHSMVIAGLRVLLAKFGALDETLLLVLGTILGVVLPAALYGMMLWLQARSKWPLARWAGLGTATRSHYVPIDTKVTPPIPAPVVADRT